MSGHPWFRFLTGFCPDAAFSGGPGGSVQRVRAAKLAIYPRSVNGRAVFFCAVSGRGARFSGERNPCYRKSRSGRLLLRPNWGARLRAAENTRTGGRPGDKTANMQPIKRIIILLLGSLLPLASSCTHDVWSDSGLPETPSGALFRLCGAEYDDAESRSGLCEGGYDRVEFCVVDASGEAVPNLKGRYDSATSTRSGSPFPKRSTAPLRRSISTRRPPLRWSCTRVPTGTRRR